MIINQALNQATKKLSRHKVGIPTGVSGKNYFSSPALDAEILLGLVLKKSKEEMLIHSEQKISARQFKKFSQLIKRRAKREPIAYIVGEKEFFGLKFFVNKNVLIPRPETELLVEEAIREFQISDFRFQIFDIGTGSGTIAVALAKNLPEAKIIATDISSAALKIARANARRHGVSKRIKFVKTNLLPQIPNSRFQIPTLIVANLPYLSTRVWKNAMPDVKNFEPKTALLGGADGLDLIKKLLAQIKARNIRGTVLLEVDPTQPKKLSSFAKKLFPGAIIEIKKDLAGLDRLFLAKI
ncbi:peptide chain release factor N(5)-glutamine methyltransferase [Candidatus Uhrbacteria bacterium]|nr:peptide chain release factor N(5)-glutamine methyltransferase [Candidatus Uhrbacteria bacterium]